MSTWIKALHTLLERTEIDKRLLHAEDIEKIKKATEFLGYKISQWYDANTLVIYAEETDSPITEYEVAALDVLLSVANTVTGLDSSELSTCTITADLIRNKWLIIENGRIRLSKRTRVEKILILSEKSNVEICAFCNILNEEGNVPHAECLKYIA